jgi:elongation factor Ts
MAEISASQVKELREKTGAGMLDCKKALSETAGDLEAAVDWLRTKGLAAAAKKSGRVAAEGLIALAISGTQGAMIELNAETDFVARNEQFQTLAGHIAGVALSAGTSDVEALKATAVSGGGTVQDAITAAISTIGENINLRRAVTLSVGSGLVASYVHNTVKEGLGKIGVLVALETTSTHARVKELGKQVAMHIAAAKPDALTRDQVDAARVERERQVFKEQAMASGKPAEIAEKMVEGRLRKYYEEVVLLEQLFVMDGKTKIEEVVAAAAREAGAPIRIAGYALFVLGEGIEKQGSDFAAEVAAAVSAA